MPADLPVSASPGRPCRSSAITIRCILDSSPNWRRRAAGRYREGAVHSQCDCGRQPPDRCEGDCPARAISGLPHPGTQRADGRAQTLFCDVARTANWWSVTV